MRLVLLLYQRYIMLEITSLRLQANATHNNSVKNVKLVNVKKMVSIYMSLSLLMYYVIPVTIKADTRGKGGLSSVQGGKVGSLVAASSRFTQFL